MSNANDLNFDIKEVKTQLLNATLDYITAGFSHVNNTTLTYEGLVFGDNPNIHVVKSVYTIPENKLEDLSEYEDNIINNVAKAIVYDRWEKDRLKKTLLEDDDVFSSIKDLVKSELDYCVREYDSEYITSMNDEIALVYQGLKEEPMELQKLKEIHGDKYDDLIDKLEFYRENENLQDLFEEEFKLNDLAVEYEVNEQKFLQYIEQEDLNDRVLILDNNITYSESVNNVTDKVEYYPEFDNHSNNNIEIVALNLSKLDEITFKVIKEINNLVKQDNELSKDLELKEMLSNSELSLSGHYLDPDNYFYEPTIETVVYVPIVLSTIEEIDTTLTNEIRESLNNKDVNIRSLNPLSIGKEYRSDYDYYDIVQEKEKLQQRPHNTNTLQ